MRALIQEGWNPRQKGHAANGEQGTDGESHQRTMAHLQGRTVLSTFGLISAGKGIETAIEALAEIVPLHPDVLYLVAGQTHPEVVKEEGEVAIPLAVAPDEVPGALVALLAELIPAAT